MRTVDLPRPDVPAAIAIVRDFVNTTDHETGTDDLTRPTELSRYLVAEGLLDRPARATADDLDLALRLRAGLRRALELNHDATAEPLPALAEALAELPVGLDWGGGGAGVRATAPGVRGALAKIGLAAHQAAGDGILVAPEDLRLRRMRVGLLRPLEEQVPELVRVRLWQQDQDPRLPCPQVGGTLGRA